MITRGYQKARPARPAYRRPYQKAGSARPAPRAPYRGRVQVRPVLAGSQSPPFRSGPAKNRISQHPPAKAEADTAPAPLTPAPRVGAYDLAQQVVRSARREKPADRVLRDTLRAAHGLTRPDSERVAKLVFAYYRWLRFVEREGGDPHARLKYALQLQGRFDREPDSFKESTLASAVVPDWASSEMSLSLPWLRSLQSPPRMWLRARKGKAAALSAKLNATVPLPGGIAPDALEYCGSTDLFRTPEFQAGEFEIQDLSSQCVGLCCDPKSGETWWDACAGEGGKMLHLSDLMGNKGMIWASDRADWRLKNLKRRASRAGCFNYRTVTWENDAKPPVKTKFDGVLLDAPCSGVGTWHRNPHARWTTSLEDVQELAAVQLRLLKVASGSVKPGGKLIYSVCTLTRSETTGVADQFQALAKDFVPLSLADPLRPTAAPANQIWYWPQDFGGNGMFIAAWQKL